mmetsp:Transcript_18022/g.55172  ORF Transcript_18022/g.55172 Transcript_18022/m.55172 type:complete len:320 (-) Transcript_18022:2416-3375(-)
MRGRLSLQVEERWDGYLAGVAAERGTNRWRRDGTTDGRQKGRRRRVRSGTTRGICETQRTGGGSRWTRWGIRRRGGSAGGRSGRGSRWAGGRRRRGAWPCRSSCSCRTSSCCSAWRRRGGGCGGGGGRGGRAGARVRRVPPPRARRVSRAAVRGEHASRRRPRPFAWTGPRGGRAAASTPPRAASPPPPTLPPVPSSTRRCRLPSRFLPKTRLPCLWCPRHSGCERSCRLLPVGRGLLLPVRRRRSRVLCVLWTLQRHSSRRRHSCRPRPPSWCRRLARAVASPALRRGPWRAGARPRGASRGTCGSAWRRPSRRSGPA